MKLREIFRFELAYQARRVSTWIYFAVLLVVSFNAVRGNYLADARRGDFFLNSPLVIASSTVLCCLLWLLVAAAVAGDAATRDVHTRMSPLTYTAPVRKSDYLGGRFFAAFALNAMILLAAPMGIFLALTLHAGERQGEKDPHRRGQEDHRVEGERGEEPAPQVVPLADGRRVRQGGH
ncbi:MAG TPA: hypothetical protein VM759_02150, partial [Longimicrobium sp.]|nr:hypothetical protein [Longimicrobium sp.]